MDQTPAEIISINPNRRTLEIQALRGIAERVIEPVGFDALGADENNLSTVVNPQQQADK